MARSRSVERVEDVEQDRSKIRAGPGVGRIDRHPHRHPRIDPAVGEEADPGHLVAASVNIVPLG
jgi:hypothetical protein